LKCSEYGTDNQTVDYDDSLVFFAVVVVGIFPFTMIYWEMAI